MATSPHLWEEELERDETLYIDFAKHKLPGYTIDEFLERGDQEGADKELMRLIQEGLDSGPGREMNEELFEEMIVNIRARAAARREP